MEIAQKYEINNFNYLMLKKCKKRKKNCKYYTV